MPAKSKSDCQALPMPRRQFLAATALGSFAAAASLRLAKEARGEVSRPAARFFFTSQGKTAMIGADGAGLHWFNFDVPNQATWQPCGFFSDGHRVLFLSMEPRRDGPGKPFGQYYHQTPTHIWVHDLNRGTLTEIATRNRMAPFYTPQLLLNDNRILMQVVRNGQGQIFSMNLDGSDAKEFTRAGEGMPYGLSLSPDGRRVAYHLASPYGYQVWVSDTDGANRVQVAGHPDHLYFCPCWSPDGNWLVFQDCLYKQDPGHDWSDLYLSRPDKSQQRLLTKGQALWFAASYGNAENHGNGSNTPSWSHDGKVLCSHRLPGSKPAWQYQSQRPDTDHFNRDFQPELARGGTEICKIDPSDGSVTRITRPGEAVWDFRQSESPDGAQIVFCRAKTGQPPAIWVMNADGTGAANSAKASMAAAPIIPAGSRRERTLRNWAHCGRRACISPATPSVARPLQGARHRDCAARQGLD